MEIRRQHETTTIDELIGESCTNLLGVGPGNDCGFYFSYLEASNTWYRFFIEHGILFWDTVAPDPEDDLAEGEDYDDLLKRYGVTKNERLDAVNMKDGRLTITFSGGLAFLIEENAGTGSMSIAVT